MVDEIVQAAAKRSPCRPTSAARLTSSTMFACVDRRFGALDALVNNAGIVDRKSRVDEMSAARIERMMRINVIGSMLCAVRR